MVWVAFEEAETMPGGTAGEKGNFLASGSELTTWEKGETDKAEMETF